MEAGKRVQSDTDTDVGDIFNSCAHKTGVLFIEIEIKVTSLF